MILKMLFNYARLCWGLHTITPAEVEGDIMYGFWMFVGLILDIIIAVALIFLFITIVIPWITEKIEEYQIKRDKKIEELKKEIKRLSALVAYNTP